MRRIVLLLAACGPLVACAAEVLPSDGDVGAATEELRVCADGDTVRGIDVSHWQGAIDWGSVAGAGIRFAFIRVSDGTGTMDDQFHRNWPEARRVGILRGVYQYFRPNQDPIAQADLLVREMGALETDDLPPVIDVEATGSRSPSEVAAAVRAWVDHVAAATGRRPIVYTGRYFWQDSVGNAEMPDTPLWVANWGVSCPDLPAAWSGWRFWQESSTGSVAGISGNVDMDRFNGNMDALHAFGAPRCTPHCDGDVMVADDCGRGDCSVFGSRCVDDAAGLRCAFAFCPSTGEADVCVDDTTLGHCTDGAVETSDCAADAGVCSIAGRDAMAAHCVSALCVASAEELPVAHSDCVPEQASVIHCDADGRSELEPCAEGTECSLAGGTAHCAAPGEDPPDPDMPMGGCPGGECMGGEGVLHGGCSVTAASSGGSFAPLGVAVGVVLALLGARRRRSRRGGSRTR